MGLQTIPQRTDATTILADWFNTLRSALSVDHVPRNASGVVTDEAGSIGTEDYQWLNLRVKNLFLDGAAVDPGLLTSDPHRITGGALDAYDYPAFLSAAGTGNGLVSDFLAASTDFTAYINNVLTTYTVDTQFTSLTAAPSSNNTCLIDDTSLSGYFTRELGEIDRRPIIIDTIGSEISDRDGEIAAFKVNSEIFLAEIDTSNNKLWPIYRGWAGTERSSLSNNGTITLMQINALLIKSDGSTRIASTYYPQSVTTSPAAGTAGKIYYERSTNKVGYDTGSSIDYTYIVVGYAVCDDTDCLYVEHEPIDRVYKDDIAVDFWIKDGDTAVIKAGSYASINGQKVRYQTDYAVTTSDIDAGDSLTVNSVIYFYGKADGSVVIGHTAPRLFDARLQGYYHPFRGYRCIGAVWINPADDFAVKRQERKSPEAVYDAVVPVGTIVAYNPGWYGDGSNGSFTSVYTGVNSVAGANNILPRNWRVCDGSQLYEADSALYNAVSGRYLPNLTDDRFLMGDTAAANLGGNNATSIAHTHVISHYHKWAHVSSSTELWGLTSGSASETDIDTGDEKFISQQNHSYDTGLFNHDYHKAATHLNSFFYTTGVLGSPGGSGSSAASGSMSANETPENRPKYLSTFYIMRVK